MKILYSKAERIVNNFKAMPDIMQKNSKYTYIMRKKIL